MAEDTDRDEFLTYRATLLRIGEDASRDHDKAILATSAAVFSLSVAISNFLPETLSATWSLVTCWIALGASVAATLFSFRASERAASIGVSQADSAYRADSENWLASIPATQGHWNQLVELLNWGASISFTVGIAFLVVFAALNLE